MRDDPHMSESQISYRHAHMPGSRKHHLGHCLLAVGDSTGVEQAFAIFHTADASGALAVDGDAARLRACSDHFAAFAAQWDTPDPGAGEIHRVRLINYHMQRN
jgi:hypothetical protein